MTMLGEDVLYLSVSELAERIRTRKLSPVELAESYLERSRQLGPRLAAYATLTEDLARQQARQAEQEIAAGKYRGPLHGVPYAAKDLLAVRGYPTTWGATVFADQRFDYDATVISRLREAGAVLLGKAAMIELAGGMGYRFASASHTGPARNPWNHECWTCGSSSGSAAIVAAGLAAFAVGSETWGSIVCPSGFTGISGLRPTYGRVGRGGAMALSYSLDKLGPLARSAADCELILSTIAGHDPADAGSLPQSEAAFPSITDQESDHQGLRIGWLTNAWKQISPAVQQPLTEARAVLERSGAQVEIKDVALPEGPWEAAAGVVLGAEVASAFDEFIESGKIAQLTDPEGRIGGYVNQQIGGADVVRANRVRRIAQKKMRELFQNLDVVATASLPVLASKITANLDDELTFPDPLGGIGNFCGLPAASVPCGFSNGLPVGLQFVGPALGEHQVLRAAKLFQQHTHWHRRGPKL